MSTKKYKVMGMKDCITILEVLNMINDGVVKDNNYYKFKADKVIAGIKSNQKLD